MNANDGERLTIALRSLAEHFDSVFILVTENMDNVTDIFAVRSGNFYATKGGVTEWLENEKNKDLAWAIKSTDV